MKKTLIWIAALAIGAILGCLGVSALDALMNFIATIYTRLFQFLAVPTIFLAIVMTLITFGRQKETGRIFKHTIVYTLLTTIAAATVGLILYIIISPGNLPPEVLGTIAETPDVPQLSYLDHILSVVPNNMIRPFFDGNVLSLLLIAFAVGFGISRLPDSDSKTTLTNGLKGLQDLLFLLIKWLIVTLPIGIVAFSAQLTAQLSSGVAFESLGKYVAVVLICNLVQFFVILPLFLISRGIHPIQTLRKMAPAVLMALFTKSSAATLPVTMDTAERRLGASPKVARFVLPICTTINMNGCAAFILVTSLFVMQNGGTDLTPATMALWLLISVVAAIGNAGVPMGCYFLTLSLMSGIGAPIAVLGLILPVYAIIDMVETAENVWSDSCVCAMTNKAIQNSAETAETPNDSNEAPKEQGEKSEGTKE